MYCGFVRGSHARLFADVEKGYRFRVMIEEWWKGKVRCGRNEASRQVRKTVQESEQGQGSHVILALTTYSSSIVCAYTEAVPDDRRSYRVLRCTSCNTISTTICSVLASSHRDRTTVVYSPVAQLPAGHEPAPAPCPRATMI